MESKDVLRWRQEEALNFNCFATVQRFANSEKVEGEPFLAPLYFDLDYDQDPAVSQADAIKLIEFLPRSLMSEKLTFIFIFQDPKAFIF